jgi:hypothetical protein
LNHPEEILLAVQQQVVQRVADHVVCQLHEAKQLALLAAPGRCYRVRVVRGVLRRITFPPQVCVCCTVVQANLNEVDSQKASMQGASD